MIACPFGGGFHGTRAGPQGLRDLLRQMKSRAMGSLFVFSPGTSGQGIGDIKTAFRAALRRSGLAAKGYRFHDIRRTFAWMLYKQGVILTKIQRLLGHKSVLTTERYLGMKFEETREAILTLDKPLRLPDLILKKVQG